MNYVDIIESIVNSTKCKLYLELGCQFGNTTRRMIDPKRKVVAVDIMKQFMGGEFFFFYNETTDKFFEHFKERPDVIFIDADHEFEAVKRDFKNSLNILNEYGTIIMHDTDPNDPSLLGKDFCDNSYKIIDWIRENYPDLDVLTLQADEPGLTLVKRKNDRRALKFT